MKRTRLLAAALCVCLGWATHAAAESSHFTLDDDSGTLIGDSGCCDGCTDACNSCCDSCGSWLTNLIMPSDHGFDCFVSPMTNPTFFEDPRTLTEARFIYIHHRVPQTAAGGEVDLFALQLRAAITDRISIIATKDGYLTSTNPLIEDGWADINAGLKFNLLADECCQRLLSVGATFELPTGSTRAQQGNGDGTFHLFATGGMQVGRGHWISAFGWILPTDSAEESQWTYWSNHWDMRLGNTNLFPFVEVNWYHYLRAGRNGINGIEGGDLFNLGSTGVAGNDIVTSAVGMKFKPSHHTEMGIAIEFPATDRRDVLDNRLTFDWILRY